MRILYHAINGSGLGHLTRLSAIALAVQQEAPDVHQLMATSENYPLLLKRLRMPSIVLPQDDNDPVLNLDRRLRMISAKLATRILSDTVRNYDPRILVFDTHAPRSLVEEAWSDGRQPVLVLPSCRDEVLAKLLREGALTRFALVLLPHTREQLAAIASGGVLRQLDNLAVTRYVGGIVFPSILGAAEVVRVAARHGIADGERLILICAGSGGYGAVDRQFIEKACRAAIERKRRDPSVRVICVAGPCSASMPASMDCAVIDAGPDLQLLTAQAELVLAQADYNTVQEVLRTGPRALLVPLARGAEDQAAFVRSLLPRPGMRTLSPSAPEAAFGRALHQLMQEPRPGPIAANGASVAARAIIELGCLPDIYICSRSPLSKPAPGRRAEPRNLFRSLKANEAQARLCIDWDVVVDVLARLGPEACIRLISIEVDFGTAETKAWEERIRRVHAAIRATGFDLQALTFCLVDASGGPKLAELAERIADLRFRSLVAHVPLDMLRAQPGEVFEAAERCRGLDCGFGIDITALETPLSRLSTDLEPEVRESTI
jgi:predicted glycosyltransferase